MSYNLSSFCRLFSLSLVFLLFLQVATAQVARTKKNDKEYGLENYPALDQLISRQQKLLGNDLVVMVWKDTLVFKKELGEFSAKMDAPVALGSQWLTTALILQLVDEGKLSLDDKVSDYLPVFSTYGKNYITLRHCLTHYTGIQAGTKLMEGKFESLEEEAAAFAKKEIQTNPGTEYRYSSAGMIIAGRIAEIVTKRKFDQLIKQKLFNPMGMTKTSFSTMDGSGVNPATGARSTPMDMMKFLQMLLNNGKINGKQILTEESVAEMRKISAAAGSITFAPKAASGFSYAMGSWAVETKGEEAMVLTAPGVYGFWPVVDWCRGITMLVMPRQLLQEQKPDILVQLKDAVAEDKSCE